MEALRIDSSLAPVGPKGASGRREATSPEVTDRRTEGPSGPERAPSGSRESSEARPAREDVRSQAELTAERRATARDLQEQLRQSERHDLEISYSEDDDRFVVRFLDQDNGEIVRQIPAEPILAANQRLDELRGLLFDEKS